MIRFRSGGWDRYASDLPPLPAALVVEELDVRGAGENSTARWHPSRRQDHVTMLAFTDSQLRTVWTAAYNVPAEKRRVFIERVVARLQLHRGFTDADLDDAVRAALTGLIQSAAWWRRATSRHLGLSKNTTTPASIVRYHNGQQLAYVHFEDEPGRRSAAKLLTKDEARRIAVNIAKLTRLLGRND
jgi:hypothetical protein